MKKTILFLCCIGFLLTFSTPVFAVDFSVNLTTDQHDADTSDSICDVNLATAGFQCSLRAAVEQANALPSNDRVLFDLPANSTVTLTTVNGGVLTAQNNGTLEIIGTGANTLTIDGGPDASLSNRIFYINQATVSISGVTLTGAHNGQGSINGSLGGGAILAYQGSLTLNAVHVTRNFGNDSGGGVYFYEGGPHQIINSTFSRNIANSGGGGFFNYNSLLTVVNSTIHQNTASNSHDVSYGGGFLNHHGTAVLLNVTITDNSSVQGGGIYNSGDTTLRNVTITNNSAAFSAGIYNQVKTLNFGNTIVAGNRGNEIYVNGGTITSAGGNLIGDSPGDSTNTNIAITYHPTDIRDVNPLLGALANNGGTTLTHSLEAGSPAIDAGINALISETFDQRGAGFLRIRDGNADGTATVDIGAFEVQTAPSAAVSISGVISYNTAPAGQPKAVAGVLMSITGAAPAYSNASGFYQIDNLTSGGYYIVTPSKTGNVNGISPFDATLVLRHVASNGQGANALTPNQQKAADTNGDGNITPFDATLILRYIAAGAPNANTGQVGDWKFDPVPRKYEPLSSNMFDQNYTAILVGEVNGDWILPTYSFNANPATLGSIPDGTGANPNCQVPGAPRNVTFDVNGLTKELQDISVTITFNPQHTWSGDILATLISPDGSRQFDLFGYTGATTSSGGGDGSHLLGPYTFTDAAAQSWWTTAQATADNAPIPAGNYRTSNRGGAGSTGGNTSITAAFVGMSPAQANGTWTLRLTDGCSVDTGSISAAGLNVTTN